MLLGNDKDIKTIDKIVVFYQDNSFQELNTQIVIAFFIFVEKFYGFVRD